MTIDSYRIVTNFVFIWQIMGVSRKEKKMGGEQSSLKVYSVIASVCVCVCVRRIRCISDETGLESESSILLLTTSPLNE